jgi:hypothetical protein
MNFNFDTIYYKKKYGKIFKCKNLYEHWLNIGRFKNMYTSENNEIIKPNIIYHKYENFNYSDIDCNNINVLCHNDRIINYDKNNFDLFLFDIIHCKELISFYNHNQKFISIHDSFTDLIKKIILKVSYKKFNFGFYWMFNDNNEIYWSDNYNNFEKKIIFENVNHYNKHRESIKLKKDFSNIININKLNLNKELIFCVIYNSDYSDNLNIISKNTKNKIFLIVKNYDLEKAKNNFIVDNNNNKLNDFLLNIKKIKNLNCDWIIFLESKYIFNINILNEIKNINNFDCMIFRNYENNKHYPKNNESCIKSDYNFLSFAINKKLLINNNLKFNNQKTKYYDFLKKIINLKYKIYISKFTCSNNNFLSKYFISKNFIINDDNFLIKEKLEKKLKFYVINLENEKKKYFNILNEYNNKLKLYDNNLYRFNAIKPKKSTIFKSNIIDIKKFWNFRSLNNKNDLKYCIGASGCKLSHYNLLKYIQKNGEDDKYHIVLEDDCLFLGDDFHKKIYDTLNFFENEKINFNILYLGCNFNNDKEFYVVKKDLLKCNLGCGMTTHAMIFKKSNISKILNIIENSKEEIDRVYSKIPDRYVIFPMIAIQREGISNISAYKELEKGGLCYNKKNRNIYYGNFNKDFIFNKLKVCE